ncbi:15-hydroxyprostaglandin dehydrogenase [NAD(+)]-like [Haemaphysalis longicornis]
MSIVHPMPCAPDYTASKCAVFGMTRSFGTGLYYNRSGVRVNCLCPGAMKTQLFYDLLDNLRASDKTAKLVEEYDKETITTRDAAQGVLKLINDQRNGSALTMMTATDVSYYEP